MAAAVELDASWIEGIVHFQSSMLDLSARAVAIDTRSYEIATAETIAAELVPRVLELVGAALELSGSILVSNEPAHPTAGDVELEVNVFRRTELPFEHAIDARVAGGKASRRELEEIVFMAHLEIRESEARLKRAFANPNAGMLLAEADASLRRILKGLSAIDATLASVAGVSRALEFTSELDSSLAVRRAYAKFFARIVAQGRPTARNLRARLRAIGTEIAIIVGSDVYRDLRIQDRLLLRELQQHLLAWLRSREEATTPSGVQLWHDLLGCVEMFLLVNRRQELVEHDRAVVRKVSAALRDLDDALIPEPVLEECRRLQGLDREIDALLAETERGSSARWRAALSRLSGLIGVEPKGRAEGHGE